MSNRLQRTIQRKVTFCGIGLHTGHEVTMHLLPAPPHSGIFFQRIDLPGKPIIPASIEYVQDTSRSTMIGVGNCSVQTVEHLLAAVSACSIDNLCIQVTAPEPPIADGSARPFLELIEEAGIEEQGTFKRKLILKSPVYFSEGNCHLVGLPANEFKVSYTLHYPKTQMIGSQYFSFTLTKENFSEQIAPCRTFALYEEIAHLMERGLIRGGSLENAVVIKDDVIFSKEGLRFKDEMVRHKILDLVGDLFLVGSNIAVHVIAICSGHRTNVAFGKKLMEHFSSDVVCAAGEVNAQFCKH